MEFSALIRDRHMVRTYLPEPVPREALAEVLDSGVRAPTAGDAQGVTLVALEGSAQTRPFWELTARGGRAPVAGGRWDRLRQAPVVVVPVAEPERYRERYAREDKTATGAEVPERIWEVDSAFAVMAMLLAAADRGLGALFFVVPYGRDAVLAHLGAPAGSMMIGAVTLGWPARPQSDSPSRAPSRARVTRPRVRYGGWAL